MDRHGMPLLPPNYERTEKSTWTPPISGSYDQMRLEDVLTEFDGRYRSLAVLQQVG